MDVKLGEILADKYRIDRILGAGGMGQVVQVTHLELDQRFAVKLMLPQVLNHPELVQRFLREAKAAVRLKSEHVARVTDVARLPSGVPYMVMEFLEGDDLDKLTKKRGALAIDEACEYVIQACDALGEAHLLGIVHRDIKPANLFLTLRLDGTPCIKVLDFGISKLSEDHSGEPGLTKTSAFMGSAYFMSPEQMQSARDVDHRADVWALGVTLYKLLTNALPFRGASLHEVSAQVLRDPPQPCSRLRAEIPSALESVVHRCLEKRPTGRYQNVGELAIALGAFAPARTRSLVERIAKVMGVKQTADSSLPHQVVNTVVMPDAAERALVTVAQSSGSTEHMSAPPFGASTSNPVQVTQAIVPVARKFKMSQLFWLAGGLALLAIGGGGVIWSTRQEPPSLTPSSGAIRPATAPKAAPIEVADSAKATAFPSSAPNAIADSNSGFSGAPPIPTASTNNAVARKVPATKTTTSKPIVTPATKPAPPVIDDDDGPRR